MTDGFKRYDMDNNTPLHLPLTSTCPPWAGSTSLITTPLVCSMAASPRKHNSSTLVLFSLVVCADKLIDKKIGGINSGLDADTCTILMEEVKGIDGD